MVEQRDWGASGGGEWEGVGTGHPSMAYVCGFCGTKSSSARGWETANRNAHVRICAHCNQPTYFDARSRQIPGAIPGLEVAHLPDDVATLYREARTCIAASAFCASVMACRKIVMHTAVDKGAKPGESFAPYVKHLVDGHFVPVGSDGWVDFIRDRANAENHDIHVAQREDAEGILRFTQQLLANVYELPSLIPPKKPS